MRARSLCLSCWPSAQTDAHATRGFCICNIPTAHANISCSQQRVCDMCWIRFTRSLVGSDFDFIYIFDDGYEYDWSGLLHLPSTRLSTKSAQRPKWEYVVAVFRYVLFSLPFIRNDANGGDGVDGNDLNETEFTFNSRCKIVWHWLLCAFSSGKKYIYGVDAVVVPAASWICRLFHFARYRVAIISVNSITFDCIFVIVHRKLSETIVYSTSIFFNCGWQEGGHATVVGW